ncbi:MAG: tetraacyldisaccharide 4'-kinase [Alphaproteobacteria bacterium]
MTLKTPHFWYRKPAGSPHLLEYLLTPFSKVYQLLYTLDQSIHKPYKAKIPVICIGNIVAGGTGKTPTAIALLKLVKSKNLAKKPVFLIRGYGGAETGPLIVNPGIHTSWDVGDEALILAKHAPTIVGADRAESAKIAMQENADLIIMDDGLQNPGIHKDLRLVVINGEMGLGNLKMMPAGPLRQPLEDGTANANGFIFIGNDENNVINMLPAGKPVTHATLKPAANLNIDPQIPYLAFAGLGYPEKFFNFLSRTLKFNIVETIAFSDHHPYDENDIKTLHTKAEKHGAKLITTEKDFMRLPKLEGIEVEILPVEMTWDNEEDLLPLIKTVIHP